MQWQNVEGVGQVGGWNKKAVMREAKEADGVGEGERRGCKVSSRRNGDHQCGIGFPLLHKFCSPLLVRTFVKHMKLYYENL